MKIVLTIVLILLQLLGSYNVEAKPLVKKFTQALSTTSSKQHYLSSSSLHHDLPAENVHTQLGVVSVKQREQRLLFSALLHQALELLAMEPIVKTSRFYDRPHPVPISRLLLFPQHYFW